MTVFLIPLGSSVEVLVVDVLVLLGIVELFPAVAVCVISGVCSDGIVRCLENVRLVMILLIKIHGIFFDNWVIIH